MQHDNIIHDDEDLDRSNDTPEENHNDTEQHASNSQRERSLPSFARYVAVLQRSDTHGDYEFDREHTTERKDEATRDKERVVITFKATVNATTPRETDTVKNRAVVTGDNIPELHLAITQIRVNTRIIRPKTPAKTQNYAPPNAAI
jgi:hypothetical protein